MQFKDIEIVGIDEARSYRAEGALFDIALKLSATPPFEWANGFDER